MITSSPQRIADYRARGWWGDITLHSMLRQHAAQHPELLAVADQPNRDVLTGDAPLRLSFAELNRAQIILPTSFYRPVLKAMMRFWCSYPILQSW